MAILEKDIQKSVVKYPHDLEALGVLTFNHVPNEGKRPVQYKVALKQMGLRAGHPDLDVHLNGGKTVFFELKTMTGDISKSQRDRMALLTKMGYPAHFIIADTGATAINQIEKILRQEGVPI